MKVIPTGSKTILKVENIISDEQCDILTNYVKEKTSNELTDPSQLPWFQNNTIFFADVEEEHIREIVNNYRKEVIKLCKESYGEDLYSYLTTMVYWAKGQEMFRHSDQGNKENPNDKVFQLRDFTSVLYLNDDYKGGETYIRDGENTSDWKYEETTERNDEKDYVSVPKKGSAVIFHSDERNAHGVSKIESGVRIVLSTWFTKTKEEHHPEW